MTILSLKDPEDCNKPRKLFSADFRYKNPLNVSEHQENRLAYLRTHTTVLRYMKNYKRAKAARAICRKLNMERNCKKFDIAPLEEKLLNKILIKLEFIASCRIRIANKSIKDKIEATEQKPMLYCENNLSVHIKFKQIDNKLSNEFKIVVLKKSSDHSEQGAKIVDIERFFKDVGNIKFNKITYGDSVYNPMNGTNTLEGDDKDGALKMLTETIANANFHCHSLFLKQDDPEVKRLEQFMKMTSYKKLHIQGSNRKNVNFVEYDALEGTKKCDEMCIETKDIPVEGLYVKYKNYTSVTLKDFNHLDLENVGKLLLQTLSEEDTSVNRLRYFELSCNEPHNPPGAAAGGAAQQPPQPAQVDFSADGVSLLHTVAGNNYGNDFSQYYVAYSKTELILFTYTKHHSHMFSLTFLKDKEALYLDLIERFLSRGILRHGQSLIPIDASQFYDEFIATEYGPGMTILLTQITTLLR